MGATEDVASVWFQHSELEAIKNETWALTIAFQKFEASTDQKQQQHPLAFSEHRGLENRTAARQRRRILINAAVLAVHKRGASDEQLSSLYEACSVWSREVAFARAVCDFATSGNIPNAEDEAAAIAALEHLPFPSSTPPSLPKLALQYAMLYRMKAGVKRSTSDTSTSATRRVKRRVL